MRFKHLFCHDNQRELSAYDEHRKRKEDARCDKQKDKNEYIRDGTRVAICFDLLPVLTTPSYKTCVLCYVRKLNVYKLQSIDTQRIFLHMGRNKE